MLSEFWNVIWQLEMNMYINQIMETLGSKMLKMDALRNYKKISNIY